MNFKLRANITFTRDLDIEADNFSDALDMDKQQMEGRQPMSELTFKGVSFEVLSHAIGDYGLVELEPKTKSKKP